MDVYAEFFYDVSTHGVTEAHDVGTRSTAAIDQDKGLFFVDPSAAEVLSLPAALLNHPACGDFYAIFNGIMRHARILLLQLTEFFA